MLTVRTVFIADGVSLADVACRHEQGRGEVEPASARMLVLVRRGCFARSANGVVSVLDPTVACFINPDEEQRYDHPHDNGLVDKGTKGKRARVVPLIPEVRPLVERRLALAAARSDGRLFVGPRGGRVSTAILRDATHWDDVVASLGFDRLRRHDLRHTGLTWMADAGVPLHHLRKIAGHGSLTTTQRYLHPDQESITAAGQLLSTHLNAGPDRARLRVV